MDRHAALLVHARGVVADVPVDDHVDPLVDADGDAVRAPRVGDAEPRPGGRGVQRRVQLADRAALEVDDCLLCGAGAQIFHVYTCPGSGSNTCASSMPGSPTSARYSEATAIHWGVSATIAGLQAIGSRSTASPSAVVTTSV